MSIGMNLEIIGKRFGKLLVLERIKRQKPSGVRYLAICRCDCGNTTEVWIQDLRRGRTTSCGCRRDQYEKIRGANSPNFTGHKGISGQFWAKCRIEAERRGIPFLLTIEQAWEIYEHQERRCALTNVPIVFGHRNKRPTASLDRIDGRYGYTVGNICWVHKSVNMMRGVHSMAHFKEICLLVARAEGWAPFSGFCWDHEPIISELGETESNLRNMGFRNQSASAECAKPKMP